MSTSVISIKQHQQDMAILTDRLVERTNAYEANEVKLYARIHQLEQAAIEPGQSRLPNSLTLTFEDGTAKVIQLDHVITAAHKGRQSIEFRETEKGWILYFTERLFKGKKIKTIHFSK